MIHKTLTFFAASSCTLIMLSMLFALPTSAFAEQRNVHICNGQQQYLKRRLDSEQQDNICERYKGKVMMVVNTASRCAYTDQYDDLEKLYDEFKKRGLVVLGFPSNDFGNQEPGNEKSIKNFCRLTYGVQFPMYAKTRVRGNDVDPLYRRLAAASGQVPQWNFHKYLIDREGKLVGSYGSSISPYNKQILTMIEQLL